MLRLSRCLLNEVGFFAIRKIVLDQESTVIGRGEKNIHLLFCLLDTGRDDPGSLKYRFGFMSRDLLHTGFIHFVQCPLYYDA